MAQIECGRGHLYDPEKYPTCPYCKNNQQITVAAAGRTAPIHVTDAGRTAPLSATPVTAPQKTAPLTPPAAAGGIPVTAEQKTMPPRGYNPTPVTAPQKTMPPRGYNPQPAAPEPTAPPKFHSPSVLDAGKTVGMMQEQMGFDPVVGWLACVEGPSRGKSYTIRGGINAIGRGDRMDITITGDRTISMENHAKISYSDRNNRFNLLPGDGRNIVYLNGEEVFAARPSAPTTSSTLGRRNCCLCPCAASASPGRRRRSRRAMGMFDRLLGRRRRVTEDTTTVELSAPRTPALRVGNVQGVGRRERQEDSFALCNVSDPAALEREGLFAVVCDGMGGMDGGNEASEAAVEAFVQVFRSLLEEGDVPQQLREGAFAVSDGIFQRFQGRSGTTAVAVRILHGALHWISVGDRH